MNTNKRYDDSPAMRLHCDECVEGGDHGHKPMVYASLDKNKWLCYKHWLKDIHSYGLKLDGDELKYNDNNGSVS